MKKFLLFISLVVILLLSGFIAYGVFNNDNSQIDNNGNPPPTNNNDNISKEPTNREKAEELLKTMTLEEKGWTNIFSKMQTRNCTGRYRKI